MRSVFTDDQLMWIDILSAMLAEERFNLRLGDMNYVLRNIIAKYVSSATEYNVSEGVEQLVDSNPSVFSEIISNRPTNLAKLFYGRKSEAFKLGVPTMFEHSIPAAVVRDELISIRSNNFHLVKIREQFSEKIKCVLSKSGRVVVVSKKENARLTRSKMPPGWNFYSDHDLERYLNAKPPVLISKKYVACRDKKICR